jgi:hypothetical protein
LKEEIPIDTESAPITMAAPVSDLENQDSSEEKPVTAENQK